MERFDIFNAKQNKDQEPVPSVETAEPPHPPPTANGHTKRVTETQSPSSARPKREADDSDLSDVVDKAPPRKKRKESSVEDDAAFAARLQAEEDRAARPTRGGTSRKAAPSKKKKAPRKKTADKVTGSDDSEVEENGAKRKVNRETGFHKPMNLSTTASDFFNTPKVREALSSTFFPNVFTSFHDHKLQSRSGNTSKLTIYKTLATNGTSYVMTSSKCFSRQTKCTCFK